MIEKFATLKNHGINPIREDQTLQSARDHQIIPKKLKLSKEETPKD